MFSLWPNEPSNASPCHRSGATRRHDGTMPDQRRPSTPGRGPRNRADRRPSAPLSGPITVDDETANALALFNARLAALADQDKAERRVQKAVKAKDDAAARVRALESDTKATADQRAEAAAAYRAAVEAVERARTGEADPAPAASEAPSADEAPDAVEGDADAADADVEVETVETVETADAEAGDAETAKTADAADDAAAAAAQDSGDAPTDAAAGDN